MKMPNDSIRKSLSATRRAAGATSFRAFCWTYLPSYFKADPSPMHLDLFRELQEITQRRGARSAYAAPRSHAKTSIVSTAYVLWCICYGLEPYIVLVSSTADQARDLLSHIKRELEGNARILEDFPELSERGNAPGPPRWRKDEIITRTDHKITVVGVGGSIRGRKHRQHRPTLVILDDVEDEAGARSPDQREVLAEWFGKALLKLGTSTTNIVVVGTILHYDSLLATLVHPEKSPGWTGRVYKAVTRWSDRPELWEAWENVYKGLAEHEGGSGPAAAQAYYDAHHRDMLQGTEVLWPQREDYRTLMEIRVREGRASFDSEKQNEPTNPDDCLFRESDLVFWDDLYASEEELLAAVGPGAQIFGACDPSLGRSGRHHDDTAIITLLKDAKGVMYVLGADIRKRKPDAILDAVIAFHQYRNYQRFAFETNQFQEFLGDQLATRSRAVGKEVPVFKVQHTSDKALRIQSLQPLVSSGGIRFSRRHTVLLEQMRQFPHAAHDDGPDALEMAVAAATRPEFSLTMVCPGMPRQCAPGEDPLKRRWLDFITGADLVNGRLPSRYSRY